MSYRMLPPPRPRRSPVILMIMLALIPAGGLAYTWQWAKAKIPTETAETSKTTATTASAATSTSPTGSDTGTGNDGTGNDGTGNDGTGASNGDGAGTVAFTPLETPVLSLRRAPQTIVQLTSEAALVNSLTQLSVFVGPTSCLVVSLEGRVLFDHGGDLPVTPASNQKLLVAAVALEALTPDYTFSTRLLGTIVEGVVMGDLYFVGGGDPLLSTAAYPPTQEYPPTSTTSLEALVANLAATGVTRIQGNVIADESRYDIERYVPTWADDVRDVEAGPLSALMVNDAIRRVEAGSTSRQPDPAVGAANELITLLRAAGISVGGSARPGVAPPEAQQIASVQSAPLSAIVAEMLTTSDDNTAELLLKELGVVTQMGNTRQAGLDVVIGTLVTWGIDTTKLTLIDGSGLDNGNIVTCNIIRQVLTHQPLSGPLGTALPTAGETGTLATDTTLGAAMAGRLHAKTGTLADAKALSGFVTTEAGNIEFSLILDFAAAEDLYPGIWTALGDSFAKFPAGPTVEQIEPR